MAITLERDSKPNLVRHDVYAMQRAQEREDAEGDDDVADDFPELTEEEQGKLKILRYCSALYDDARKAREPYETFDVAWDLFIGNVWPSRWPTWRAKITINKIRAFITFMQAVMTDNKPRISVDPLVPGTEDAADLLRKLVDRDWDENDMQAKISIFVLYGLVWGTGFMKIAFDPKADGGRGRHIATPIVPYRIFSNRTATCVDDAEFILHVEEQTMGWVRRNYPERAAVVHKVKGMRTLDSSETDRDFIREGDSNEASRIISAANVNGNIVGPQYSPLGTDYDLADGDSVEIMECWLRDETLEAYQKQKVVNGVPQTTEAVDPTTGLYEMEVFGHQLQVSPIDGSLFLMPLRRPKRVPVMEPAWREKYPNGRLVVIAGARVLLRDIPNPFQTDGFPFAMWKDYDVGAFWGQGEPLALKDSQIASNRILSQVYDILEKTGNPSWKLKKGGGVNASSIKNKPGAIIPMEEMDSLQPLQMPPMPQQFVELYGLLNTAMSEVSGITEAVRGGSPGANTSWAMVDQLQESGAAPIRLKVRNLETGIGRIGKLRVQLIQQYDRGDRPLRERVERPPQVFGGADGDEPVVVPSAGIAEVKFREYTNPDLQGPVEFGVVPISSLSTSPAGLWNRWMDLYKLHLVDRRWWHQKFRLDGWKTELPRMERQDAMAAQQKAVSKKKPGPAPSKPARSAKKPQPPISNIPTRAALSSTR